MEARPPFYTYMHLQLAHNPNHSRATLVIKVQESAVEVGVSFCGKNDAFKRSTGRELANKELTQANRFYFTFTRTEGMRLKEEAVEEFLDRCIETGFVNNIKAPAFAFHGALDWDWIQGEALCI